MKRMPALLLLGLLLPLPGAAAPPPRIYVGAYLHDVTKFDQKDGVFDVDAEVWVKWLGEFDPKQLVIANAAEVQQEELGRESDGEWHSARWRLRGTLRGEFPLQRYPFDAQTLALRFELPDYRGELVPDLASSGMRDHFSVTGWLFDPVFRPRSQREVYRSDLGRLAGEGRPTAVRRVSFEVTLHRPPVAVGLKLLLPLGIILLVSLIALFIAPEEIEARAGIGITSLLACFAFHFTVADTLPDVAYLTLADSMFIIVYVITASAVAVTVIGYNLCRRERQQPAITLDRTARLVLPLAALLPVVLLSRAPSPPATLPPPLPEMKRQRSARSVLRIGAVQLSSLLAAPVNPGVRWSLVKKTASGERLPIFVESVPDVSNQHLRFLAGGQLEVTWRLRQQARWSDGAALTSADLLFGTQLWPDPEVIEVRAPDRQTLVLRYRERVARALEAPGFISGSYQALHRQRGYEAMMAETRVKPGPVLGPYRVVEFQPQRRLVVEANPHFLGPPPSIRRVEVTRFPGGPALAQAFLKGQIDLAVPNCTTPALTRELARQRPQAVRIQPSGIFSHLQPDLSHPLLGRLKVRRALLMAIDRERLIAEVYGPEGRLAHTPVPGFLPTGLTPVAFDREQARRLLAAEGALGTRLPLFHPKLEIDYLIAERITADLRAAGIDLQPRPVDNLGALHRQRKHGGLLLWAYRYSEESSPLLFWNLPLRDGQYQRTARNDAYSDQVAALVERESRALYPERRRQLREALFTASVERLPLLPLLFASERLLVDPALRGWDRGPRAGFGEGLEDWYFEESKPAPSSAPAAEPGAR